MTTDRPSILTNRVGLLVALVFCIYEALPRAMTTLPTDNPFPAEILL